MQSYHEGSKHHYPHGYAPGPGYMDWENQPDPFRHFGACRRLALPLVADGLTCRYEDWLVPGKVAVQTLDRQGVGALLELSLAISAWKEYMGERWALRCHPASGNLHPLEGYLLLPSLPGLAAGVYHYHALEHCLEHRFSPADSRAWDGCFPPGGFFIGLSVVPWRVMWKYGQRSWRYCNLDAGHGAAAIAYGAATLGWHSRLLSFVADEDLIDLLGLAGEAFTSHPGEEPPEGEEPVMLLQITAGEESLPLDQDGVARLVHQVGQGTWQGVANRLTPGPLRDWPAVSAAMQTSRKGVSRENRASASVRVPLQARGFSPLAKQLIRQRRSGQSFDKRAILAMGGLFRILDRVLYRPLLPPWSLLSWPPWVQLVLLVHQCEGVAPGVYWLPRRSEALQTLRHGGSPLFSWTVPPTTPGHLPLFNLLVGDCRNLAVSSSCHQEFAGDGVFAVAMVVDMEAALAQGAWNYRAIHWEAGILGQVLYLEAEAEGLNGAGIGCFFDGLLPERLALPKGWQDIYHFTVGRAVADNRLTTLPPYGWSEVTNGG